MVKIHVFDVVTLPRRVLDRTWHILGAKSAENDPNLAPQDDPKSTKNRVQKMIKILIEKKTAIVRHCALHGRNARRSRGDYRGVKKLRQRRFCHILQRSMAKILASSATSSTLHRSSDTPKLRPLRGGRRIQPLRAFRQAAFFNC